MELGNNKVPKRLCSVCGDWGTGKHYGTWSCYGCKGFFQRTVRKGVLYVCRINRNCDIMKERRNKCRYCRFKKCMEAGMKREAVQDERDKMVKPMTAEMDFINVEKPNNPSRQNHDNFHVPNINMNANSSLNEPITIALLFEAEAISQKVTRTTYSDRYSYPTCDPKLLPVTQPPEVFDAFRMEFHNELEWAKQIPAFKQLEISDQIALLKAHASELATLEMVRRSMHADNCLVTSIGKIILPNEEKSETNVRIRTIKEILEPCKSLKTQDWEFLCLKAIILFDPDTPDLEKEKEKVGLIRAQVTRLLESCIDPRVHQGRVSALLLLIPKLYSINLTVPKLFRSSSFKLPRLLDEMITPADDSLIQSADSTSTLTPLPETEVPFNYYPPSRGRGISHSSSISSNESIISECERDFITMQNMNMSLHDATFEDEEASSTTSSSSSLIMDLDYNVVIHEQIEGV